jgi:GDP/UDP-N,N'-diacetylbacillosamine 2-epimerase (hydrolysing)
MRKICVVTGTRAEYGLLYWLMKELLESSETELKIIVTGSHLSPEFGLTCKQIEQDGFAIDSKVEMLLSSDSEVGITKSVGVGLIGFADALYNLKPELLVVLGDRFEMLSVVIASMISKIPIAHISGGETTEGAFDESIRHSITKMSHLHFTATDEYYNRVIQLGEQPNRVFNVGAVGIDNITYLPLLSKDEFEKSIHFKLAKHNLLVTFHPVTLEKNTAKSQFKNLLQAVDERINTHLIFTKTNADTGGRIINKMIDDFVARNPHKAVAYISLGQLRYLSAMQHVDGVIGNSSSGLVEAPSFKIGTINIGDRQLGRIKSDSVIDCNPSLEGIKSALLNLYSSSFQKQLEKVVNPYGKGGASKKIVNIIKSHSLNNILKKKFYNL